MDPSGLNPSYSTSYSHTPGGEAESLYRRGMRYLEASESENKDVSTGLACLLKAAELNHPGAWYELGNVCKEAEKFDQAFGFFENAANLNHPEAIFELGNLYKDGQGVTQDEMRGEELIQKAADMGCIMARNSVAMKEAAARGLTLQLTFGHDGYLYVYSEDGSISTIPDNFIPHDGNWGTPRDTADLSDQDKKFYRKDCRHNAWCVFIPGLLGAALSPLWIPLESFSCDYESVTDVCQASFLPTYGGLAASAAAVALSFWSCVGSCCAHTSNKRTLAGGKVKYLNCCRPCPRKTFVAFFGLASFGLGVVGTVLTATNIANNEIV